MLIGGQIRAPNVYRDAGARAGVEVNNGTSYWNDSMYWRLVLTCKREGGLLLDSGSISHVPCVFTCRVPLCVKRTTGMTRRRPGTKGLSVHIRYIKHL